VQYSLRKLLSSSQFTQSSSARIRGIGGLRSAPYPKSKFESLILKKWLAFVACNASFVDRMFRP
jgi:hypothetical protein